MRETAVLIFNKQEWLSDRYYFKWSEKEIDGADESGLIGKKHGISCYVTKNIPVVVAHKLTN